MAAAEEAVKREIADLRPPAGGFASGHTGKPRRQAPAAPRPPPADALPGPTGGGRPERAPQPKPRAGGRAGGRTGRLAPAPSALLPPPVEPAAPPPPPSSDRRDAVDGSGHPSPEGHGGRGRAASPSPSPDGADHGRASRGEAYGDYDEAGDYEEEGEDSQGGEYEEAEAKSDGGLPHPTEEDVDAEELDRLRGLVADAEALLVRRSEEAARLEAGLESTLERAESLEARGSAASEAASVARREARELQASAAPGGAIRLRREAAERRGEELRSTLARLRAGEESSKDDRGTRVARRKAELAMLGLSLEKEVARLQQQRDGLDARMERAQEALQETEHEMSKALRVRDAVELLRTSTRAAMGGNMKKLARRMREVGTARLRQESLSVQARQGALRDERVELQGTQETLRRVRAAAEAARAELERSATRMGLLRGRLEAEEEVVGAPVRLRAFGAGWGEDGTAVGSASVVAFSEAQAAAALRSGDMEAEVEAEAAVATRLAATAAAAPEPAHARGPGTPQGAAAARTPSAAGRRNSGGTRPPSSAPPVPAWRRAMVGSAIRDAAAHGAPPTAGAAATDPGRPSAESAIHDRVQSRLRGGRPARASSRPRGRANAAEPGGGAAPAARSRSAPRPSPAPSPAARPAPAGPTSALLDHAMSRRSSRQPRAPGVRERTAARARVLPPALTRKLSVREQLRNRYKDA